MTRKKILFIAYWLSEKKGIGSARSRSLLHFLKSEGYCITVAREGQNLKIFNRYSWLLKIIIQIILFRGKTIYLSVGPYFSLFSISLICKLCKKELIVDFRDPWSLSILTGYGKCKFSWELPKSTKFKIALWIEKFTYKHCKYFVVCTEGMRMAYEKLFEDNQKICLIQNGYDFTPSVVDFNSILRSDEVLRIICVGKFAEYNYQKALDTVSILATELQDNDRTFHFMMVGCDKHSNKKLFEELQLNNNVTFIDRVSYEEAMRYISLSDIGMTLIREDFLEYGTKIFDYIGMGKPVWAIYDRSLPFYKEFKDFLITDITKLPKITNKDIAAYSRTNRFKKFKEIL